MYYSIILEYLGMYFKSMVGVRVNFKRYKRQHEQLLTISLVSLVVLYWHCRWHCNWHISFNIAQLPLVHACFLLQQCNKVTNVLVEYRIYPMSTLFVINHI